MFRYFDVTGKYVFVQSHLNYMIPGTRYMEGPYGKKNGTILSKDNLTFVSTYCFH